MGEPLVLSASSLTTFLRCGQQWWYGYVAKIKSPPTLKQLVGTAAHEAVETNLRQKIDSGVDLPLPEVQQAFSDAWDRDVKDVEPDDNEEHETPGEAKDSGIRVITTYQKEVSPKLHPILVEHAMQFTINGIAWSGVLDSVDQRAVIRDLKTTARKPQGSNYILNMTGYALGYRHEFGTRETGIALDYIVRTKKPYYHPVISGGPIDDAAIATFAGIVTKASESIAHGDFLPNGLIGSPPACSWCGYRNICPAYRAKAIQE
jgi:RecB family exonuclease